MDISLTLYSSLSSKVLITAIVHLLVADPDCLAWYTITSKDGQYKHYKDRTQCPANCVHKCSYPVISWNCAVNHVRVCCPFSRISNPYLTDRFIRDYCATSHGCASCAVIRVRDRCPATHVGDYCSTIISICHSYMWVHHSADASWHIAVSTGRCS